MVGIGEGSMGPGACTIAPGRVAVYMGQVGRRNEVW